MAEALTYYGRWTYKFEEAARKGAVGALIIHRTDLASYAWQVVRSSWSSGAGVLSSNDTRSEAQGRGVDSARGRAETDCARPTSIWTT